MLSWSNTFFRQVVIVLFLSERYAEFAVRWLCQWRKGISIQIWKSLAVVAPAVSNRTKSWVKAMTVRAQSLTARTILTLSMWGIAGWKRIPHWARRMSVNSKSRESIFSLKSKNIYVKFGLTFSHKGMSSSSKRSLGSFPIKISQPLSGVAASHPGGGPPYFLCPFSCKFTMGCTERRKHL